MAYPRLNPTVIALNELPVEGRSFSYSRESGELNSAVADLIKDTPYTLSFHIKPIGNAFEMKGEFSTTLGLICSRCAIDFALPLKESFHEILMVEEARPRTSQTSRPNHVSDLNESGPYANMLRSYQFDIGEFFHEIMALAEPLQPLGKGNCDDSCENYQKAVKEGWFEPVHGEKDRSEDPTNPFAVLKQLKN